MSASQSANYAQAVPAKVAELINSLGNASAEGGPDLGWTQEFYEWTHAHLHLSACR